MVGVYAVLWDKHVDDDDKETRCEDNILEAVKCCSGNNSLSISDKILKIGIIFNILPKKKNSLSIMPTFDEADEDVETGKVQAVEKEASLVVVVFCRENGDNVSRC